MQDAGYADFINLFSLMLYNALRRRANHLKLLQKNARKVYILAPTSYHDAESEINPNAVQLDEVQVSRCSFFLPSKSLGVYFGVDRSWVF